MAVLNHISFVSDRGKCLKIPRKKISSDFCGSLAPCQVLCHRYSKTGLWMKACHLRACGHAALDLNLHFNTFLRQSTGTKF